MGHARAGLFDFTEISMTTNAAKIFEQHGKQLLLALVGDECLAPFWPLGTGANRAVLSAMDAAWCVRSFGKVSEEELLQERENVYRLLSQTDHHSLKHNFKAYTIDPRTRYPNIPHKPIDVNEVYVRM